MKTSMNKYIPILILALCSCGPTETNREVRNDYKLTSSVLKSAEEGWRLYSDKEYSNSYAGGYYTDASPDTKGYDFWSNGVVAKYDREGNGHHETIFVVNNGLKYVGSIGKLGVFIDTSKEFSDFLGKYIKDFEVYLCGDS